MGKPGFFRRGEYGYYRSGAGLTADQQIRVEWEESPIPADAAPYELCPVEWEAVGREIVGCEAEARR